MYRLVTVLCECAIQELFKRMIDSVFIHVTGLPDSIRSKIIAVQACFGSTSDYISYKRHCGCPV